jgi:hypothetical protein
MLIDHRTYTCKPGTIQKQLALYEKHGMVPQKRHLGEPLAYLVAESGKLNTYIHIWVYKDAADRATRRAAMMADPEWQEFLKLGAEAGYLVGQETCLMTPASFAPITGR